MSIAIDYVTIDASTNSLISTKHKPNEGAISSMLALRRFSKTHATNPEITERVHKAAQLIYDNFELKRSWTGKKNKIFPRIIGFIKKICLELIMKNFTSISSDSDAVDRETLPLLPYPNQY